MNYEIHIDETYWPRRFPEWKGLTADERKQRMGDEAHRIDESIRSNSDGFVGIFPANFSWLDSALHHLVELRPLLTGEAVALIDQERRDHYVKHGFDAAHDDQLTNDELTDAAIAVLTEDIERWPQRLSTDFFWTATEKGEAERRVVAAALLAADVDRILRARQRVGPPPQLVVNGRARVQRNVYDAAMNHGIPSAECEHLTVLADRNCTVLSMDSKRAECTVRVDGMSGDAVLPNTALLPLSTEPTPTT